MKLSVSFLQTSESSTMEFFHSLIFTFHILTSISISAHRSAAVSPPCRTTCGTLSIKYPFGTGYGCGSPRFSSQVTCSSDDRFLLNTHTGNYPITSISYSDSTVVISPPSMSTCSKMHESSQTLGIDWTGPFQLGSSAFLLLDCKSPSVSLSIRGSGVCDLSYAHLCASIYSCPSVVDLGLPLFPPTNSCCVYSPANFDGKGELDLRELKCGGFSSIVSLGEYETNPMRWEYGVELKYGYGALENSVMESKCKGCEMSGGACGFTPPENLFVCVCERGFNTTTDCKSNDLTQEFFWSSASSPVAVWFWSRWFLLLVAFLLFHCGSFV
ncbi:uncharacterized protein LOC120090047 [Benincasa hispida]|uniref:uncharacterized protein LOC120090047 n=1 Tax=Benincasa hispida TaxID=102211 RepID=UPI00190061AE|nr:uncharacterized protein LOC120090047 [Benincasa hispida]